MSFELTDSNYYSLESDQHYCSNSQLKLFQDCEHRAMEYLKGNYEIPQSEAMLIGSYVDCALTEPENFEQFKKDHPEMYSSRGSTKGLLKSSFARAEKMVEKVKGDEVAMKYLDGEHQTIFTGNLFGVDFKAKLDVYIPNKAIVDLKTVSSLHQSYWDKELQRRVSFMNYFKYTQQLAIYQTLVFQNTGKLLPCYILAVTKEEPVDIELIYVDNETLHDIVHGSEFSKGLADDITQIRLLKSGEVEPIRCGCCDLCVSEKHIERPIHFTELEGLLN